MSLTQHELALLRPLAETYPTTDHAHAEIAFLEHVLTMPKGTVHVVSDVHGEYKKLRHIINNASGSMRPLLHETFGDSLDVATRQQLLNTIYYPRQLFEQLGLLEADESERMAFVSSTVRLQFQLLNTMRRQLTLQLFEENYPPAFRKIFRELLWEAATAGDGDQGPAIDRVLRSLVREGRGLSLVRRASRLLRNLSVFELVVAGDLGDRGPRLDKVAELLTQQPRVRITWGNHDIAWVGACLGHRALVATVVRVSLRYGRLAQLEEGYGIPLVALEKLARTVYADDRAEHFRLSSSVTSSDATYRDAEILARMQKAIAIIQFKLESQAIRRNPDFEMSDRDVMAGLDVAAGTVTIGGVAHPLRDRRLPTVDPDDPCALSAEEQQCIETLRGAFVHSPQLWRHINHWNGIGSMHLVRDHHVIFHGCVPVDDEGEPLEVVLEGRAVAGRELFGAYDTIIRRAVEKRALADLDHLWYLWCGPRSPLFGKSAMTTFERYFIADKKTYKEHKNPYFKLLHQRAFCEGLLAEFGAEPSRGMIVNGHVPVRPEGGEGPIKDSRRAVTIDGAFSESYGDRGFTLILEANRTCIAEHHHFDSVHEALASGADIIPSISPVHAFDSPRLVSDTELGAELEGQIAALRQLIVAYREMRIPERPAAES